VAESLDLLLLCSFINAARATERPAPVVVGQAEVPEVPPEVGLVVPEVPVVGLVVPELLLLDVVLELVVVDEEVVVIVIVLVVLWLLLVVVVVVVVLRGSRPLTE